MSKNSRNCMQNCLCRLPVMQGAAGVTVSSSSLEVSKPLVGVPLRGFRHQLEIWTSTSDVP